MARNPVELIDRNEIVELTQKLVQIPSQYIEGELVQHSEFAEYAATADRSLDIMEVRYVG